MFVPILFVLIIWFIKGLEQILETNFHEYGVISWDFKKLSGIISFPLIHADFSHLINNTYPILILGGIISSVYKDISNRVFLFSYLLSGTLLWFFGNPIPVRCNARTSIRYKRTPLLLYWYRKNILYENQ